MLPQDGPIQLHPGNPHYFLYKGKTLALVTSAEHYGALINLDFDYRRYLETLAGEGMNYTRIFTGSYFEIPGESFGIQYNTLAPDSGRVITPWPLVRDETADTLRYDLSSWNEPYFTRLRDLMTVADSLDIIVEVTLFSSIYRDEHWDINPQNPQNNINIKRDIDRRDAHTTNNGPLFNLQAAFVRKLVHELNAFDNFFFEIQNEPWSDNPVAAYNIVNKEDLKVGDWSYKADFAAETSLEWQELLAALIREEEAKLDKQHLIAQNYTNFRAPIPQVSDHISIINFHYAWPDAVAWNYHYNRVIGFDESGFAGTEDQVYRRQAWQFMLSGGGLFNHLDYSFYVGEEGGRGVNNAPGGGSRTLRKQLKVLSDFLHSLPLADLRPDDQSVKKSPGLIPYVLSDGRQTFALYLRAVGIVQTELQLATGEGIFVVQLIDPLTGSIVINRRLAAREGMLTIPLEMPAGEMAVKVIREADASGTSSPADQ